MAGNNLQRWKALLWDIHLSRFVLSQALESHGKESYEEVMIRPRHRPVEKGWAEFCPLLGDSKTSSSIEELFRDDVEVVVFHIDA